MEDPFHGAKIAKRTSKTFVKPRPYKQPPTRKGRSTIDDKLRYETTHTVSGGVHEMNLDKKHRIGFPFCSSKYLIKAIDQLNLGPGVNEDIFSFRTCSKRIDLVDL